MRHALLGVFLLAALGNAQDKQAAFQNDPAARAIYDKMLATLLDLKTLYYESEYWWGREGREDSRARYKAWLKKPNHFRIEAIGESGRGGTCVGDGTFMWTFWRGDRPHWSSEHYKRWEETSRNVYMRAPTPLAGHSIAHKTPHLGAGMSMTVLNPSKFHGAPSSMDKYLDGVRSMGVEIVDGLECDVIEVSYMSHQRSKIYWIAREDSLPRKQRGIVRVGGGNVVANELWTKIRINEDIPDERFVWKPPDGWREWRFPPSRDRAVKVGKQAPAFEASLLGGGKTRLSDYRGKIVWLCFWRVG